MNILLCVLFIINQNTTTDTVRTDTTRITFDFKEADVRDVLRAVGIQTGTNIVVDNSVEGKITVHLENVGLEQGLRMMLEANGFSLEKEEGYYLVKKLGKKQKKDITATGERITLNIQNLPVDELIQEIANQSKINIIADQTVTGDVSGILYDVPLEKGLSTLLSANGYMLKKVAGIYQVTKAAGTPGKRKGLSVTVGDDKSVSLNVSDADIGDVLDEISNQADLNVVSYGEVRGSVNAKMDNVPLENALSLLFQGTNYTFRKDNDIYLVGEKALTSPAAAALTSSKLIHLRYIKADIVPQFLPKMIPAENVKVVKEQNAILIFGTEDLISLAENFIKIIDLPSPQVLIEAVVVEYSKSVSRDLGFRGLFAKSDSVNKLFPEFSYAVSGKKMNEILDEIAEFFNLTNLGKIPANFWLMIDALESKGKAKVKARPRIATVNGNEASIDVGWVSYYRTTTGTVENPIYQLHSIDAGIKLKIIPWVSKSGEITTVIQTEVSNLKAIGPDGLPEIARRTANTTINLKDGETIAIGGLIQTSNVEVRESVPVLGSIPVVGTLFSHTTTANQETELVIYITPRIIE
jgi:type IV pilus assembly protein PilQ